MRMSRRCDRDRIFVNSQVAAPASSHVGLVVTATASTVLAAAGSTPAKISRTNRHARTDPTPSGNELIQSQNNPFGSPHTAAGSRNSFRFASEHGLVPPGTDNRFQGPALAGWGGGRSAGKGHSVDAVLAHCNVG